MVEESMARKQLYNMLYDMMKDGDISGYQFIEISINNLIHEEAEDVISETIQYNIPAAINDMIPIQYYEEKYAQLFELILEEMIAKHKFKAVSTIHLLIDAVISSAKIERHITLVHNWFKNNQITNLAE